jgi:hypothetical protein
MKEKVSESVDEWVTRRRSARRFKVAVNGVAPTGSRLYRRLATGTPHEYSNLPIANRRYSRLPTCYRLGNHK